MPDLKAESSNHPTSISGETTYKSWLFARWNRFGVAAVVLIHLALVIPLAATLNIWNDEALTLRSTGGGLIFAVQRAISFEYHPPLYFVILTLWRTLDGSLFFARLFSIIFTASTVALSGGIARRYLPGIPSALVAALVAFNPLTIYAAVDARMYAMALFLCALLLLLFHDGYLKAEPSLIARRWYTAAAIVSLYTHYFLGFLLAAAGATLLLLRRGREVQRYGIDMLITAGLFAPFAMMTAHQFVSVKSVGIRPQTLFDGVKGVWNVAWGHLLPISSKSPFVGIVIRQWVTRLAIPVMLLVILIRHRRPSVNLLSALMLAGVVGLFMIGIEMHLGPDFMARHHTTVFCLPILISVLALLQYIGGKRVAVMGAVAGLLFAGLYLLQDYAPLAKEGDWIRVSRYLQQHENASEPILVFRPGYVFYLGYHYTGRNRLIPLPRPVAVEGRLGDHVLRDEREILEALHGQLSATQRFWLITSSTGPYRGIDIHPEILEGFVRDRCTVLRDESFMESRVRLLERRQITEEEWGRHPNRRAPISEKKKISTGGEP